MLNQCLQEAVLLSLTAVCRRSKARESILAASNSTQSIVENFQMCLSCNTVRKSKVSRATAS